MGIIRFFTKNIVMTVALVAAVVTAFFVPPDSAYLGYFDFKTLACLFTVLATVCALKNINFFYILAFKIIKVFKTARLSILALIYITFIGSMIIANDMALITFLPLGYLVLSTTGKEKYMAFTFIMQNIAANLGGMLTPFGNPQNLYLYTKFNIPTGEFTLIMLPPFLISIALITLACLFIKPETLNVKGKEVEFDVKKSVLYLLMLAFSIIMVFRIIPYYVGLIVIPTILLFTDKKALREVDYPLLLTFVFFFVFSGNMSRIGAVRELFSFLLQKSTLLFGVVSCQFISNVPSAILLSQFTDNYRELLLAVNIGGVGTLISSLASLITFREYVALNPTKTGYYIKMFSIYNFAFLIILTVIMLIV